MGAKAQIFITAEDLTGPGLKKVQQSFQKVGSQLSSIGRKMSLFITTPLAILGGVALKAAADFEKQQVAFEVMLGSAEKAGNLLKDIIDFSAKTPFKLPGLQTAAARLLGFGIEAEKVVNTMNMLGNAAMGDQARLDRLTLAFGKLRAKGKATLEELNMFLEAGVPILDELSRMYGVTTQDMFEMISKGKIGFEDVNKALTNLTTGTGMFAGMLEKQSQTLSGLFSTILDNLKLLGMEIMQTILPAIKEFATKALKLIERLRGMNERTKKLIVIVAGLTAVVGPLMIALGGLVTMLNFLAAAGGPVMWVIAAIGLLVTAGILLYTHWEKVSRFLEQIWVNIATTAQQIFQAVKIAVLQPLIDILNGLRFIRELFGGEATKIINAIQTLTNAQVESAITIKELGDRRREANKTAKALREEEKKLAEVQAEMNEVLITAPSLVEDYTAKIDDLTEAEEELLHNINHTSERLHAADNAMWEASLTTDKYAEAMQRLGDEARRLNTKLPEITDNTERLKEEVLETADVMEKTWGRSWEIMGDQTKSGADKIKEIMKNMFVYFLEAEAKKLLVLAAEAFAAFNIIGGTGFMAAAALAYGAIGFIQSLAQGGITTDETLAHLHPNEAVIPLDSPQGRRIMGPTINVYNYISGSVQTEKDLAETIAEEIGRQGYSVT